MEKHRFLVCFGFGIVSFLMIFSFALASANTLVGGKIYNSDFSEVVEGADVSVQCGLDVLETESLADGTYAVNFGSDVENCDVGHGVEVSASKGTLAGKETSIINNSTEGEGEFVAVGNVNLKAPGTTTSGGSKKTSNKGTWFMCGNHVCDTGESYSTCPTDCLLVVENNTTNTIELTNNGNNDELGEEESTTLSDVTGNPAGMTGAVVSGDGSGKGSKLYIFLGLGLLLIITLGIISLTKRK